MCVAIRLEPIGLFGQVEIVCRFRQDHVDFIRSAQAEIVCRFHRDRGSISPGVHWSSVQILKNLHGGECRKRGLKQEIKVF